MTHKYYIFHNHAKIELWSGNIGENYTILLFSSETEFPKIWICSDVCLLTHSNFYKTSVDKYKAVSLSKSLAVLFISGTYRYIYCYQTSVVKPHTFSTNPIMNPLRMLTFSTLSDISWTNLFIPLLRVIVIYVHNSSRSCQFSTNVHFYRHTGRSWGR